MYTAEFLVGQQIGEIVCIIKIKIPLKLHLPLFAIDITIYCYIKDSCTVLKESARFSDTRDYKSNEFVYQLKTFKVEK